MSTELLLWQLSRVGSAPWLSSREQTSTLFLDAASWRGVNCHRSMAFTHAPCWRSKRKRQWWTEVNGREDLYKLNKTGVQWLHICLVFNEITKTTAELDSLGIGIQVPFLLSAKM